MKYYSLVALTRATGAGVTDVTHSYELIVHNMDGSVSKKVDVKINTVDREFTKLRMTKMRHAVRYMNTFKFVAITPQEYEDLLKRWGDM